MGSADHFMSTLLVRRLPSGPVLRRIQSAALRAGIVLLAAALPWIAGCKPSLPPSKPLSQLTPQEASGHEIYAANCARCHYANSESGLHGPGLQGMYRKPYLPSGAPSHDDRVRAVIVRGRNMMPGYGNSLSDQQIDDLMAYLHTL
jgi:mono/diheme cytochrome c family protein